MLAILQQIYETGKPSYFNVPPVFQMFDFCTAWRIAHP
jgi:hypothetical protein